MAADEITGGHDSSLCGAKRRQGEDGATCRRPAGWGTTHVGRGPCKLHGGATWSHTVVAQREESREVAVAAVASVRDIEYDPDRAPEDMLRRTAAVLERRIDALDAAMGELPLVDPKGRPHGSLGEWRKLTAELRSTATALLRAGTPDTLVNVGVGVTVDLDGDRLAVDLLAALVPWPDALNAARDVLAQHLDAA